MLHAPDCHSDRREESLRLSHSQIDIGWPIQVSLMFRHQGFLALRARNDDLLITDYIGALCATAAF
jgi:hypothetical protein